MLPSIQHLLTHSGLPGPRGNLTLLSTFAHKATAEEVNESLSFLADDLPNSPEEFVAMCGIVGSFIRHRGDLATALSLHRPQASHRSWRVREAVAIGIQEVAEGREAEVISLLGGWEEGNPLEKRAVVAALCEPKLLKDFGQAVRVLQLLGQMTKDFEGNNDRLDDGLSTLRQALGYGWSVVVAACPAPGKKAFEFLCGLPGKHVRWIVRENLKKHRLHVMDPDWVDSLRART